MRSVYTHLFPRKYSGFWTTFPCSSLSWKVQQLTKKDWGKRFFQPISQNTICLQVPIFSSYGAKVSFGRMIWKWKTGGEKKKSPLLVSGLIGDCSQLSLKMKTGWKEIWTRCIHLSQDHTKYNSKTYLLRSLLLSYRLIVAMGLGSNGTGEIDPFLLPFPLKKSLPLLHAICPKDQQHHRIYLGNVVWLRTRSDQQICHPNMDKSTPC